MSSVRTLDAESIVTLLHPTAPLAKSLEVLNASDCRRINDVAVAMLVECPLEQSDHSAESGTPLLLSLEKLRVLNFNYCSIGREGVEALVHLPISSMPYLEEIHLQNQQDDGASIPIDLNALNKIAECCASAPSLLFLGICSSVKADAGEVRAVVERLEQTNIQVS
jgi:hypothetical protein